MELESELIHSVALMAEAVTYKHAIIGNSILDRVAWEAESQSTVKEGKSKSETSEKEILRVSSIIAVLTLPPFLIMLVQRGYHNCSPKFLDLYY